MRIVAGKWKGQTLKSPAGPGVRPTTDRVKESMFNLLGPYYHAKLVVDLFAGTGALGLEAMSRGAERCIFVDKLKSSIRTIMQNLALCQDAAEQASVWQLDWRRALDRLAASAITEIDDLFLDPPYAESLWVPVIEYLVQIGLSVTGFIVCEHPIEDELPEDIAGYQRLKSRSYGDICISIYRLPGEGEPS